MNEPRNYVWGVGRRKKSVARVRISKGGGTLQVNKRELHDYFNRENERLDACAPLKVTKASARYDIMVTVVGGGMSGQAGAMQLGVARALAKLEPDLEQRLKDEGYLTRDSRAKERKKYGRRGARRGCQFSKR